MTETRILTEPFTTSSGRKMTDCSSKFMSFRKSIRTGILYSSWIPSGWNKMLWKDTMIFQTKKKKQKSMQLDTSFLILVQFHSFVVWPTKAGQHSQRNHFAINCLFVHVSVCHTNILVFLMYVTYFFFGILVLLKKDISESALHTVSGCKPIMTQIFKNSVSVHLPPHTVVSWQHPLPCLMWLSLWYLPYPAALGELVNAQTRCFLLVPWSGHSAK